MKKLRRAAVLTATLIAILGMVTCSPAQAATTYYFSTSGSDSNNGLSESAPKQTPTAFNNLVLTAGDSVKFKGGDTWNYSTAFLVSASEDGTSSARINIQRYGPEGDGYPVFTGGSSTQCWRVEGSWVNLDNIKTTGCNYGMNIFGDHALLQNVNSSDNTSAGVKVSNSGSGHAQYSRVTQGTFRSNNEGAAQSIEGYGVLVNADDVEVDHNLFEDQSTTIGTNEAGSAVELFNASRTNVHHNWTEDSNGFSEVGRDTVGGDADANVFRFNRIHADCGTPCSESGGFNIRGADSQYGPVTNTVFEHNTVKVNGEEALVCSSGCPDSTVIKDNVFVGPIASYIDDDGSPAWVETGNVFDGATNPSGWAPHSSSAEGTMVFQTGTGNLRAASGSLAIDRGSTNFYGVDYYGTTIPQGSAPDSGYYELPV